MKRHLLLAAITMVLSLFLAGTISQRGLAFDPFGQIDCSQTSGDGKESPVCGVDGTTNPVTGSDGVINKIANIFAVLTSVAAVIALIIGGFEYVRSGGDSAKVNKAKNTIIYALIGLVVVAVARSAVALMVNKI